MTTPADLIRNNAAQSLGIDPAMVEQVWIARAPLTHQLHQDDVYAISTKGARKHANETKILEITRRFMDDDWGEIKCREDIEKNQHNTRRDQGIVMGLYSVDDGTVLWVQQNHRFVPPTVMLPEEQ